MELTTEQIAQWENLGLSNDFIFGKVMQDPALCKEMLERILDIEIDHLEYLEPQKSMQESLETKGIRLDIYVRDDKNTIYNCEVQTTDTKELPKRSRYYQSMLDTQELEKGKFYSELPQSFIIFICTFDAFKLGRHKYTFEYRCVEDTDLPMGDEATKLFLNTEGIADDVSEPLKAFLNYMGGRETTEDGYVAKLKEALTIAKQNQKWRNEYMTLRMRDEENVRKGVAIGEQTRTQEIARDMLLDHEPIQKIMKYTKLSEEEILELAKQEKMAAV